ncbi:MAG: HD-GYP domain-containing protein [Phycisphaerae bacterium]|nr:HD-GYP domain-containing protein [Phycisphaerae bacterium]
MTASLESLLKENEGLADEVLRTYEQLNLIFDVTAQIAGLTDAYEVKRLLCERLKAILNAQGVWCVGRSSLMDEFILRDPVACGNCTLPPEVELEINELASRAIHEERVVVRTVSSPCAGLPSGGTHAMAGPLRSRDGGPPLVVTAVRCCAEFTAGDMLLLDSVLAYGGHVLRNMHLVERLKRTSFEAVRALVSAIDKKDPYTCGHSERVGVLARLTGQELGLSPEQLQELEWAGLLHDIGKIGIPEAILNKPGKLTDDEYAIIKRHPQMSYEVLKPVASLAGVMRIVIEHHENFDGTGYPNGLRGEEISLAGRVMHVVDVFDALTSDRSYRRKFDTRRALGIIQQESGTKMDPAVVEKFIKVVERVERLRPPELEELFGLGPQEAG